MTSPGTVPGGTEGRPGATATDRILELRENFSACDAAYVALAEGLGAGLLTADRSLARATRRHTEVAVLP